MKGLKFLFSLLVFVLAQDSYASDSKAKCETSYGPKDAPITVVAYTSATCHHCADFHVNVLPKIREKYTDKGHVRLVVVPFAMDRQSLDAYKLVFSLPPHQQEMALLKVFSSQPRWINKKPEVLGKILGMTEEQSKAALNDKSIETTILSQAFRAQKDFQVEAAPTFYMGGRKIEGAPTLAEFDVSIEEIKRLDKKA